MNIVFKQFSYGEKSPGWAKDVFYTRVANFGKANLVILLKNVLGIL
jgi:hypothetical protein